MGLRAPLSALQHDVGQFRLFSAGLRDPAFWEA